MASWWRVEPSSVCRPSSLADINFRSIKSFCKLSFFFFCLFLDAKFIQYMQSVSLGGSTQCRWSVFTCGGKGLVVSIASVINYAYDALLKTQFLAMASSSKQHRRPCHNLPVTDHNEKILFLLLLLKLITMIMSAAIYSYTGTSLHFSSSLDIHLWLFSWRTLARSALIPSKSY